MLEWVRGRSPEQIPELSRVDVCLNVVSPDEVDGGEDESQFRKIMRQQWIFELTTDSDA